MYPRYCSFSRPQLVFALFWLLLFCSAAVAQDTAATQIPFSDRVSARESPSNPAYPPDTVYVPLLLNVTTALEGWTEYNPSTCVDVSTGSYTIPTKPRFGKVSTAIVDGPATSGSCIGTVFPYNVASYTWSKTTTPAPEDFFSLQWTTPDGMFVEDSDWLAELLPQSEETTFNSWSPAHPTVGRWAQTLELDTINYEGVKVQEIDPGGEEEVCVGTGTTAVCTPDTCYYPGSRYPPLIHISGGPSDGWTVQKGNVWGLDSVGWGPSSVTYYRRKGRAPCGTTFPQQMQIQFATGDPTWYNYGSVNTLGYVIDATTVTSMRAGAAETETWP
jgi:hypothetical protein